MCERGVSVRTQWMLSGSWRGTALCKSCESFSRVRSSLPQCRSLNLNLKVTWTPVSPKSITYTIIKCILCIFYCINYIFVLFISEFGVLFISCLFYFCWAPCDLRMFCGDSGNSTVTTLTFLWLMVSWEIHQSSFFPLFLSLLTFIPSYLHKWALQMVKPIYQGLLISSDLRTSVCHV